MNGQSAHKTVLNSNSPQRNANENHNNLCHSPPERGVGGDVEGTELSDIAVGRIKIVLIVLVC